MRKERVRNKHKLAGFSSNQIRCSKAKHTISFASSKQQAGPGRYGYDTTGALHEFKFLHVTCQFITGFIVRQRVARHLAALVDFPWVQHFEHAFFPLWKVVGPRLSQVSIFLQPSSSPDPKEGQPSSFLRAMEAIMGQQIVVCRNEEVDKR